MHKLILLLLTVTFSLFTFSAGHETPSGNEGAFTTLMLAAPNVDRYVDFLKADKKRGDLFKLALKHSRVDNK